MVDFKKSFEEGLSAAEQVDNNISEINEVLKSIDDAIREATKEKVNILVEQQTERYLFGVTPIFPKKYFAIMAINVEDTTFSRELARWKMSQKGYPCQISWGEDDISCHEKETLENVLSTLLSDPIVAKKIKEVMDRPIKKEDVKTPTSD